MSRPGGLRQAALSLDLGWVFGAFLRSFRRAPVRLFRMLLLWQARFSERRHLSDLPDYALRDVGLTRDEIEGEIRKPFWRQ